MAFKPKQTPPPPPPVEEQTVIPSTEPASEPAEDAGKGRAYAARMARLAKKVIEDVTSGASSSGRANLVPGWEKALDVIKNELTTGVDEHGNKINLTGRMDRMVRQRKLEGKIANAGPAQADFTSADFQWALAHYNHNGKLSFSDFAGLGIFDSDISAAASLTPEQIAAYGAELTARRAAQAQG